MTEFKQEYMCEFWDYRPQVGETCEYRLPSGLWVPCEVRTRNDFYRRRYSVYIVDGLGQTKIVDARSSDLRPVSS